MNNDTRAIPSTIAIEQHLKDELVSEMKEQNYLGFESAHNEDLFLYTLALGWTHNTNTIRFEGGILHNKQGMLELLDNQPRNPLPRIKNGVRPHS